MRVQTGKLRQPSLMVWLLHWVSAILVLYLLLTSLTSGLGVSQRVSAANWMDWHLSAGIAVFVTSAIRLWTSNPWKNLVCVFRSKEPATGAIKSILLLTVFATAITGLTIYQKSPFGKSAIIFEVFPMPTLIRLNHSVHNVVIDIHIALALIIAALIVMHVIDGFRKNAMSGKSRFATMAWPWRREL